MEWLESRAVRPRQARYQAALRPDIVIIDCSVLLEVATGGICGVRCCWYTVTGLLYDSGEFAVI